MSILASNFLLLPLLITISTIIITWIIKYEDIEIWLLEALLLRELPQLRYCTVLRELDLGKCSIVLERELCILTAGEECTLTGGDEGTLTGGVGLGCVSTGNNTGRSSEDCEEEDELNTGGVAFLVFYWLITTRCATYLSGRWNTNSINIKHTI